MGMLAAMARGPGRPGAVARASACSLLGTLATVVALRSSSTTNGGLRRDGGLAFQMPASWATGAPRGSPRPSREPARAAGPDAARGALENSGPSASALGALAGALGLLIRQSTKKGSPGRAQVAMRVDDPYDRSKPGTFFGSQTMRQQYLQWNQWYAHGEQVRVRVSQWTGRPLLFPMCLEEGDLVQIMKGKEKGKVAIVMRVFPKWHKILLKNCNMRFKNIRPRRPNEVGRRVKVEVAMDASRVMLYSEKFKVASNVGYKFVQQDGALVKQRYLKKTGEQVVKKRIEEVEEEEEEPEKNILEKAADGVTGLLPGADK